MLWKIKVHKQQDLIATDGEDPGFLIHFASDATVHTCMNTRLLANIHPPLSRGKKILYV